MCAERPAADRGPRSTTRSTSPARWPSTSCLFMDGIDTFYATLPRRAARPLRPPLASRPCSTEPALARSATTPRPISAGCASSAGRARSSRRGHPARPRPLRLPGRSGARTTASSRCARRCAAERITCIDAAILAYGLLELLFPDVKRRLLAIHRRDPATARSAATAWRCTGAADGKVGRRSASRASPGSATATPSSPTRWPSPSSYARGLPRDGLRAALLRRHHARGGRRRHRLALLAGRRSTSSPSGSRRRYAVRVRGWPARDRQSAPAAEARSPRHPATLLGADARACRPSAPGAHLLPRRRPRRAGSRYGELLAAVDRLAAHLCRRRSACGAAIASPSSSPNRARGPGRSSSPLLRLGAVVVPLNPGAPPEDWAYILDHCGARGLSSPRRPARRRHGRPPELVFAVSIDEPRQAPAPASAARCRRRTSPTSWRSSSTPRAPPATPRASASARATCSPTPGAWRSNFRLDGDDAARGAAALPRARASASA